MIGTFSDRLLEKLENTSNTSKTKYPLGKHPNNLMPKKTSLGMGSEPIPFGALLPLRSAKYDQPSKGADGRREREARIVVACRLHSKYCMQSMDGK